MPNELGGKNFGYAGDNERKMEFDRLLQDFTVKYEKDPQYDYVKRL